MRQSDENIYRRSSRDEEPARRRSSSAPARRRATTASETQRRAGATRTRSASATGQHSRVSQNQEQRRRSGDSASHPSAAHQRSARQVQQHGAHGKRTSRELQREQPQQTPPSRNTKAARPPLAGISLLARVFVALMLLIAVVAIILPDAETSTTENRSLQTMPQVSVSSITSGRFQDAFTDYVSDQFPARTLWADVQVAVSTLAGGMESNGVYRCKDGYLIQPFEQPEDDRAAAAIEAFHANHGDLPTHVLIAPTAVNAYADKLPFGATTDDQGAYIDSLSERFGAAGMDFIDVRGVLTSERDDIYYHTDHHWTSTGAYLAFQQAAGQLGVDASTEYEQVSLTSNFSGSLKSKSGYFMTPDDELSAYVPTSGSFNCIITYVEEQQKVTTPYETTALDGSDPYQLFFGGNHAQIRIETPNLNGRTLLVIKDSYANCFLPFLIGQYERIFIVDPRYCYDSIDGIIGGEGVTEVLFLYNATTFSTDTSLASMMGL